jgi:hypothetical protein
MPERRRLERRGATKILAAAITCSLPEKRLSAISGGEAGRRLTENV